MDSSYSERREAQERQAAKSASDERVRRCHEELAKLHAGQSADEDAAPDCNDGGPGLVIIESRPLPPA